MNDLNDIFDVLINAGVIIRYPEFAIKKFKSSSESLEQQLIRVFEQGRSIGTHIYKDPSTFHLDNFKKIMSELGISNDTASRLIANLRGDAPFELSSQESF